MDLDELISLKVKYLNPEELSLIMPEEILNAFNKYFVNISSTIQTNFRETNFLNSFLV